MRFYGFLRAVVLLFVLLLAVDNAAHIQGWHLGGAVPDLLAVEWFFAATYASFAAYRLILCLGCLWIKLKGIKSVPKFGGGKGSDDVEAGPDEFPMVLVQIPMCNEKELDRLRGAMPIHYFWPFDLGIQLYPSDAAGCEECT
ncbi:hypothetical protein E2562_038044 [Oryza meyeriana var. granulata]|uniref:DUF4220 domain-containing protein n=1 Tax=Oryza meyeriana var. granulata TaxID=110450 RepID=A0A6G1EU31_9ORYZ|nr:hypothetical protein E2562_038044 [Oryza meyeriana var. granulata]